MNKKRHTLLKKSIEKNLRIFAFILAIVSLFALGQYIANQENLTPLETKIHKGIFGN